MAGLPLYAGYNTLGTAGLLSAMAAAGVTAVVRAFSMVVYGEGRYCCPIRGTRAPAARAAATCAPGGSTTTAPAAPSRLTWDRAAERAVLDPRSSYAASKVAGALRRAVGAPGAGDLLRTARLRERQLEQFRRELVAWAPAACAPRWPCATG